MESYEWNQPYRPRFNFSDDDRDALIEAIKEQRPIWVESFWYERRTVFTGVPVIISNRYLIIRNELTYRLWLDSIADYGLLEARDSSGTSAMESR